MGENGGYDNKATYCIAMWVREVLGRNWWDRAVRNANSISKLYSPHDDNKRFRIARKYLAQTISAEVMKYPSSLFPYIYESDLQEYDLKSVNYEEIAESRLWP